MILSSVSNYLGFLQAARVGPDTFAYDIRDLVDGGSYFVRIFAENQAGLSKKAYEIDDATKARKPISKHIKF